MLSLKELTGKKKNEFNDLITQPSQCPTTSQTTSLSQCFSCGVFKSNNTHTPGAETSVCFHDIWKAPHNMDPCVWLTFSEKVMSPLTRSPLTGGCECGYQTECSRAVWGPVSGALWSDHLLLFERSQRGNSTCGYGIHPISSPWLSLSLCSLYRRLRKYKHRRAHLKKTAFLGSFMKSTKHASMVLYRPSWCSKELCSNVAVRENCTYTYSQCSAPSWLSAVHEAAETKRFLWEQTCTWWGVTPSHSCICIFNQLESYKMYYKRLKVTSEEPSTFFLSWFVFVYLLSSLSPSFTLSLSLSLCHPSRELCHLSAEATAAGANRWECGWPLHSRHPVSSKRTVGQIIYCHHVVGGCHTDSKLHCCSGTAE